ncbi:hypothetical protein AGDE_14252 [Angomonas deanei]|uniref:Uncharacterized protein n=1 Tax=Angomonas deanei TaxID=59799 RepID=A0A7G2C3N4_9TRYP|nr:hypothetical protein AGDE_14252 [Angomonas deanei]CAD2214310.1 hypothetical protein, conserved [Angomonas deanei]|eukprot:EPY21170.1 hypothetical protein AGDE_14252 [Angomonas deanei]
MKRSRSKRTATPKNAIKNSRGASPPHKVSRLEGEDSASPPQSRSRTTLFNQRAVPIEGKVTLSTSRNSNATVRPVRDDSPSPAQPTRGRKSVAKKEPRESKLRRGTVESKRRATRGSPSEEVSPALRKRKTVVLRGTIRERSDSPIPRFARQAFGFIAPVRNQLSRGFSHLRESASVMLSRGASIPVNQNNNNDMNSNNVANPRHTTRYSVKSNVENDSPNVSGIRETVYRPSTSKRYSVADGNGSAFLREVSDSNSRPQRSDVIGGPHSDSLSSRASNVAAAAAGGRPFHVSELSETLSDLVSSSRSRPSSTAPPPSHHRIGSTRSTTLSEPNVSPIRRESYRPSTRAKYVPVIPSYLQREGRGAPARSTTGRERQPPPSEPPVEVVRAGREKAVERPSFHERTSDRQESGRTDHSSDGTPPPLFVPLLSPSAYALIGKVSRSLFIGVSVLLMTLSFLLCTVPLFYNRSHPEDRLARLYVNSDSELHALYMVPAASLSEDEVRRLFLRTLSEGIERLERATLYLTPTDESNHPQRVAYYRQMIRAYVHLRHTSLMYARSRDASRKRRWITYSLEDMWQYGIGRRRPHHSPAVSVVLSLFSPLDLAGRVWTSASCFSQQELLPCMSLTVWKDQMLREAVEEGVKYYDVNAAWESEEKRFRRLQRQARVIPDMDSEVYLNTLLDYIKEKTRDGTRDYL